MCRISSQLTLVCLNQEPWGGLPSISTKPFARSVIRCPAHDSDSADLKTNTLLVEACCTSLCAFWGRDTKKHGSGGGGCSGVTSLCSVAAGETADASVTSLCSVAAGEAIDASVTSLCSVAAGEAADALAAMVIAERGV